MVVMSLVFCATLVFNVLMAAVLPAISVVFCVTVWLVAYSCEPFTASVLAADRSPFFTLVNCTGAVALAPPRVTLSWADESYITASASWPLMLLIDVVLPAMSAVFCVTLVVSVLMSDVFCATLVFSVLIDDVLPAISLVFCVTLALVALSCDMFTASV